MTGQFRRDVAIACLRFQGWRRIRQAGPVLVQPAGLAQQPVSRAHSGPNMKLTAGTSSFAPSFEGQLFTLAAAAARGIRGRRAALPKLGSVARIEDLYDVPAIEVELAGGYFDGRRMRVPDNRDTWRLPVPPGVGSFGPEPDVTMPALDAAVYRWAGSVRDDGTRVFRFAFMS